MWYSKRGTAGSKFPKGKRKIYFWQGLENGVAQKIVKERDLSLLSF